MSQVMVSVLAFGGDKPSLLSAAAADVARSVAHGVLSGDVSIIDRTVKGLTKSTVSAVAARECLSVVMECVRAFRALRPVNELSSILPGCGDSSTGKARRASTLPVLARLSADTLSLLTGNLATVQGFVNRARGDTIVKAEKDAAAPIGRDISQLWQVAIVASVDSMKAADKAARDARPTTDKVTDSGAAGAAEQSTADAVSAMVAEQVATALQPANLPAALALSALSTLQPVDLSALLDSGETADTLRAVCALLSDAIVAHDARKAAAAVVALLPVGEVSEVSIEASVPTVCLPTIPPTDLPDSIAKPAPVVSKVRSVKRKAVTA